MYSDWGDYGLPSGAPYGSHLPRSALFPHKAPSAWLENTGKTCFNSLCTRATERQIKLILLLLNLPRVYMHIERACVWGFGHSILEMADGEGNGEEGAPRCPLQLGRRRWANPRRAVLTRPRNQKERAVAIYHARCSYFDNLLVSILLIVSLSLAMRILL